MANKHARRDPPDLFGRYRPLYTTQKNKKNTPDKFEFKKYDPVVRKHVIYKEGKIK